MMIHWNRHGHLLTLALLTAFCLSGWPVSAADPPATGRYFEALRERGLYRIGEEYAAARLASSQLTPHERLNLSIEFARTLVEHGILQEPPSRQELWDRASQLLAHPGEETLSPQDQSQLEVWKSLLKAEQAQALAFRAEIQPEQTHARQEAVEALRHSIDHLRQTDSLLETARADVLGLTTGERHLFRGRVQLATAESLLWKVRLEPTAADSAALLGQADVLLGRLDHDRDSFPEGFRKGLLLRATIARLQGKSERAEQLLDRAASQLPEQVSQDLILTERIRLDRSRKRLDEAARRAVERIRQSTPLPDELRAETVETFLEAAELAARKGDALTEQQALSEAQRQHELTGRIWRWKTNRLLQRSEQDRTLGLELSRTLRQALAAWESGEVDRAIEDYRLAADIASRTGLADKAFEYGLTRASILIHKQRWTEARSALQDLSARSTGSPRLAEAHLLLCYVIGQESPRSPRYEAALREHLQQFPESASREEALWMLALHLEQRGELTSAIDHFRKASSSSPHKDEADLHLTRLLERMFKEETDPARQAAWNKTAAEEIRRLALPLLSGRDTVTAAQCRTLLQCLQLCLLHQPPLLQDAGQLLTVVRGRITQEEKLTSELKRAPDPVWKELDHSAIQLQIFLLASQGNLDEARTLLQQRSRDNPDSLLVILSSLTDLTSRLELANLKELGLLQRMTINELAARKDQMTPEQRLLLERGAVQASIALEDWSAAVRTLEDLHQQFPDDLSLLRQLIDVSEKRGAPEDWQRARAGWTRLEGISPKGTPVWIEARLQIARIDLQNGDYNGARKLLGVTRTLYPQMGTPELKQQADQLWKELQQQAPFSN